MLTGYWISPRRRWGPLWQVSATCAHRTPRLPRRVPATRRGDDAAMRCTKASRFPAWPFSCPSSTGSQPGEHITAAFVRSAGLIHTACHFSVESGPQASRVPSSCRVLLRAACCVRACCVVSYPGRRPVYASLFSSLRQLTTLIVSLPPLCPSLPLPALLRRTQRILDSSLFQSTSPTFSKPKT